MFTIYNNIFWKRSACIVYARPVFGAVTQQTAHGEFFTNSTLKICAFSVLKTTLSCKWTVNMYKKYSIFGWKRCVNSPWSHQTHQTKVKELVAMKTESVFSLRVVTASFHIWTKKLHANTPNAQQLTKTGVCVLCLREGMCLSIPEVAVVCIVIPQCKSGTSAALIQSVNKAAFCTFLQYFSLTTEGLTHANMSENLIMHTICKYLKNATKWQLAYLCSLLSCLVLTIHFLFTHSDL